MADRKPPLTPDKHATARRLSAVAPSGGGVVRSAATLRTREGRRTQPKKSKFPSLFAELKSLAERSGAALGDAYTRAASSVLTRLEQLEDQNAERRSRQRAEPSPRPNVDQPQRANEALPPAT
jgi:hypothetical protein